MMEGWNLASRPLLCPKNQGGSSTEIDCAQLARRWLDGHAAAGLFDIVHIPSVVHEKDTSVPEAVWIDVRIVGREPDVTVRRLQIAQV